MLDVVLTVLYGALWLFVLLLLVRLVLDWVQVFARDWRPRGVVLVVAEVTYTVTDPPIKAVRRVVPPLNLGGIRLDLAFLIVMVTAFILQNVVVAVSRAV